MRRIESSENAKLKAIRKLRHRKYRDGEHRFVIEGENLLEEALSCGFVPDIVLISEDHVPRRSVLREAELGGAECFELPRRIFEKEADAGNGVGVLAVVRKPDFGTAGDILRKSAGTEDFIVMDRMQDPGNVGTVIRTAYAAGFKAVFALKGTADIFSPKVLRSTAGLIFRMPVIHCSDAEELISLLKETGHRLTVTDPSGGAAYYDADLTHGNAVVIGNEGGGIAEEIMDKADQRINIPMRDGIESLNAAVSAAVIMYGSLIQRLSDRS